MIDITSQPLPRLVGHSETMGFVEEFGDAELQSRFVTSTMVRAEEEFVALAELRSDVGLRSTPIAAVLSCKRMCHDVSP